MVVVPAASPETSPEEFTVPAAGLLLLQVPEGVISPSEVVKPAQTVGVPVMEATTGISLTVTIAVAWQPVANV